jgi:hypothetical protein
MVIGSQLAVFGSQLAAPDGRSPVCHHRLSTSNVAAACYRFVTASSFFDDFSGLSGSAQQSGSWGLCPQTPEICRFGPIAGFLRVAVLLFFMPYRRVLRQSSLGANSLPSILMMRRESARAGLGAYEKKAIERWEQLRAKQFAWGTRKNGWGRKARRGITEEPPGAHSTRLFACSRLEASQMRGPERTRSIQAHPTRLSTCYWPESAKSRGLGGRAPKCGQRD